MTDATQDTSSAPSQARARRSTPPTSGLVIVDKPAEWTSHDVVGRLRRLAGTRRVGHAGTLDPMATGVLVVGIEKATRLLHHLVLTDKGYDTTIRLGVTTNTDDAEGEITACVDASALTDTQIEAQVAVLRGEIMQVPSAVSAIKVNGVRAYKRAREGEEVVLAARPVTVSRFEIASIERHDDGTIDLVAHIDCSSGTYIRALARDLGRALGVGGHLTTLRRTRVGPFTLADAQSLEALAQLDDPVTLPLAKAVTAAMPVRHVSEEEVRELSYGRPVAAGDISGTYAALATDDDVVALLQDRGEQARPVLVFTPQG